MHTRRKQYTCISKSVSTIIACWVLTSLSVHASPYTFVASEAKVLNANTIELTNPDLPSLFRTITIVLENVDVPAVGREAKCRLENQRGQATMAALKSIMAYAQGIVVTNTQGWDNNGKFMIASLSVDGEDLGEKLISLNVARKKVEDSPTNWCLQTLPPPLPNETMQ